MLSKCRYFCFLLFASLPVLTSADQQVNYAPSCLFLFRETDGGFILRSVDCNELISLEIVKERKLGDPDNISVGKLSGRLVVTPSGENIDDFVLALSSCDHEDCAEAISLIELYSLNSEVSFWAELHENESQNVPELEYNSSAAVRIYCSSKGGLMVLLRSRFAGAFSSISISPISPSTCAGLSKRFENK